MRELTKSFLSFSWAMSLFGVRQAATILSPDKATASFNHVTDATKEELGSATEAAFKAGDNLQRSVVDLTFGVFLLEALNPTKWAKTTSGVVQRAAKATSDVAQQAVGVVGKVIPATDKNAKS